MELIDGKKVADAIKQEILNRRDLDDSLVNYIKTTTFTTPSDCCYLLFNTKLKNNADKIQLEQGDTIHDYYLAYNGGGN